MAQAKLTISHAQAMQIQNLVHKKKPVYPILFDPRSGVNLRETTGSEMIEVPLGADLLNLQRFQTAGYFDVVEGTILPHLAAFSSISLDGTTLTVNFSAAVSAPELTSTASGAATDDIIFKVNGVATATTFGAVNVANAITTAIDATNEDISVQITQAGASKIKDANRSAILPATRTLSEDAEILSLTFGELDDFEALIDSGTAGISIDVVYGTNITSLTPNVVLSSGATISPSVNDPIDFTDPVVFTVTSESGKTKEWRVTVGKALNTATDIKSFGFKEQQAEVAVNEINHTVTIVFPLGTDITGLLAEFTLSEGAVAKIGEVPQESGVTQNDFTPQLTYTVISEKIDVSQDWIVTSSIA